MLSGRVLIPRTALPAAGLGTRFSAGHQEGAQELLPVVDTPGIELVAEEAAEAGAERLVIVTSKARTVSSRISSRTWCFGAPWRPAARKPCWPRCAALR